MNPLNRFIGLAERVIARLTWPQSLFLLFARVFVGLAFFRSGLTKLQDWDTTLFLFQEEYHVPLLPPEIAAYAGTFGETVLPLLLFAGIATRFSAFGLSVVNIVAVLSLAEIAPVALMQHQLWGALLLVVLLWGGGKLALDRWLVPRSTGGAS